MDVRDRLVVVGKTGYGKSTWTKKLAAELYRARWRVLAFDPCDEYSKGGPANPNVAPGPLPYRCTVAELVARPELLDAPRLGLAVVSEREPKQVARDFSTVASLCRHTGNLVLLVEEVGYFAEHAGESLKAVATLYRKYGIAAVFVAQRATQIPLTARSQASVVVAFRQDEPPDLEALALKCGDEFAAAVGNLPVGRCEIWRDGIRPLKNPEEPRSFPIPHTRRKRAVS